MTMSMTAVLRKGCTAALVAVCSMTGSSAQTSEELARRQYDNGMELLRGQKYGEALRDFQAVLDAYPTSSVADNALLELARYHVDVTRNYDQAQAAKMTATTISSRPPSFCLFESVISGLRTRPW